MSAYSKTNITRSAAKQILINKLISNITDEELEALIDRLIFGDVLRECHIVNDGEENEDNILQN